MRWKLLRRRLSISAPRMTVRSHLPWPLRWALAALALGFSAAIALWAFEFGKSIAGLDKNAQAELSRLRESVAQLREERDSAQLIANTAESLLKAERAAQDKLAQQLKQMESDNLALKADLGFFERLLPAASVGGINVRALRADMEGTGRVRYQALLMQVGRAPVEFVGRYEFTLTGQLDGKPWTMPQAGGAKPLQLKQSLRLEGVIDLPAGVALKQVQLKVMDAQGAVKASQLAKLG